MGKQKDRYGKWAETEMNAWLSGDVEASVACYSDDCTRISVNPFGDDTIIQGSEAIRTAYADKAANWQNKQLISFEVLSANKEQPIFHAWKSWTTVEGKEKACTYIQIVKLDRKNRCTEYREWNVVKVRDEEAGKIEK